VDERPSKVLLVVGTRPEVVKLAPVARALRAHPRCRVTLCSTGQHDALLQPVLDVFGLPLSRDLGVSARGGLAELTAGIVTGLSEALRDDRPDWVVVQGDTTTAFASALAAFYEGCPVAHVEAGLRTGTLRAPWPEEGNRRLVSQLADLHLAPTARARRALLEEGIDERAIRVTGNPGIDALRFVVDQIERDAPLRQALDARFSHLSPGRRLVLVTHHRRESLGEPLEEVCRALAAVLRRRRDVEILWPVHPNPAIERPVRAILGGAADVRDRLHLVGPTDYRAFVYLMRRATLVITDSGGIQEEAPSLGLPVLVTRDLTERIEAVEAGAACLVGTERRSIVQHTLALLDDPDRRRAMEEPRALYGDGNASERIVEALFGAGATGARGHAVSPPGPSPSWC